MENYKHDLEYINGRDSHLELQLNSMKRIENNMRQIYKKMKIILLIVAIIVVLVVFVSAFLLWHDIQILQKIESMQNTEGIRAIEHID